MLNNDKILLLGFVATTYHIQPELRERYFGFKMPVGEKGGYIYVSTIPDSNNVKVQRIGFIEHDSIEVSTQAELVAYVAKTFYLVGQLDFKRNLQEFLKPTL